MVQGGRGGRGGRIRPPRPPRPPRPHRPPHPPRRLRIFKRVYKLTTHRNILSVHRQIQNL